MKAAKKPELNLSAPKAEFIRLFNQHGYSKSKYDLYRDFLTMAFTALAKPVCVGLGDKQSLAKASALEADYMRVVNSYDAKGKDAVIRGLMPKLLALTAAAMEEGGSDFLGEIYHVLELHNKDMGQFFTPYHLCSAMAQMVIMRGVLEVKSGKKKYITVDEPASGGGAMILAVADEFTRGGIDITKALWVRCTDLSEMAYKMCYIQLALRGVPGVVWHGNTLSQEMYNHYYTPGAIVFIARNGFPKFDSDEDSKYALQPDIFNLKIGE